MLKDGNLTRRGKQFNILGQKYLRKSHPGLKWSAVARGRDVELEEDFVPAEVFFDISVDFHHSCILITIEGAQGKSS